jgi:hypothetical protein
MSTLPNRPLIYFTLRSIRESPDEMYEVVVAGEHGSQQTISIRSKDIFGYYLFLVAAHRSGICFFNPTLAVNGNWTRLTKRLLPPLIPQPRYFTAKRSDPADREKAGIVILYAQRPWQFSRNQLDLMVLLYKGPLTRPEVRRELYGQKLSASRRVSMSRMFRRLKEQDVIDISESSLSLTECGKAICEWLESRNMLTLKLER